MKWILSINKPETMDDLETNNSHIISDIERQHSKMWSKTKLPNCRIFELHSRNNICNIHTANGIKSFFLINTSHYRNFYLFTLILKLVILKKIVVTVVNIIDLIWIILYRLTQLKL